MSLQQYPTQRVGFLDTGRRSPDALLWVGYGVISGRRMISLRRFLGMAVLTVIVGFAPALSAQNLVGRVSRGLFGIKAGLISRMTMDGVTRLNSEIGSTAQVFADFPKGKGYYLSVAFDFYYIEINRSNQIMIEPNIGIKRSFRLSSADMELKPGASFGFAYLSDTGDLPSANFVTFKFLLEVHFKIDAKKAWVGELALFNAPKGSNRLGDLSLGPGLMLRWGLAFR